MHWLSASASTLSAILPLVPWAAAAGSVLLGIVCGLALGLLIVTVLHKNGLLRRKARWLNYAVKAYWLLIPAPLALAGGHIGLARCVWQTADPLAYVLAWCKRTAGSASLRQKLRTHLVDTVHQASGIDRTTIETALKTTLGQLADGNIVSAFARERLAKFFWTLVNTVLLFVACLLLLPAAEIGLARRRGW